MSLTAEQNAQLAVFREEMRAVGLNCTKIDRPRAEEAIRKVYETLNQKPPVFLWARSPLECCIFVNILKDSKEWIDEWTQASISARAVEYTQQPLFVYDYVIGQLEIYWISYYIFARDFIGVKYKDESNKMLDIVAEVAKSCFWYLPYGGDNPVCICSERPLYIKWDMLPSEPRAQLHCVNGPSIAFEDGFSVYAWHGISISPSLGWIFEHPERVTKETILGQPNTEIRRVICERVGWPRALELLGGTVIHSDELHGQSRVLYLLPGDIRVIKLINGTVEPDGSRHTFIEGVPNDVSTCHDAEAWAYGIDPNWYKEGTRT